MNEIFKKFNVFDYFSHLVPGAIVVLALLLCHYNSCCDCAKCLCLKSFNFNSFSTLSDKLIEDNTIAFWTFFLVASHCIGLVNNVISDLVWYGFRNNTWLIRKEDAENNCSFIIKLVILITLSVLFSLLFITIDSAWVSFASVALALFISICVSVFLVCKKNSKDDLNSYYEDYELVKDKYPSNNISNLEAQIAFLRNSIIPLVLLSLICIVKDNSSNTLLIISPFIAFAAFFLHQQKLYFHVYELCHIIGLNKGQEKKSPEIRIIINKTNNIHE